jgi:hypothetical protein
VNFVASCFARDQKVEEERTVEKESNTTTTTTTTTTTKEICFLFLSVVASVFSLRLKEV